MTRSQAGVQLLMVLAVMMVVASPTHALDVNSIDHLRASDAELAEQRGGWINRNGVELSFGLEQLTVVDGEVMHHRVAGDLCPGCGFDTMPTGILLRSDAEGTMLSEFAASGIISVLQNSLDNVRIGQVTVLNIGFTGAGVLDSMPMLRLIEAGRLDGLPSM